ncbi:MAG: pyridoxamine 5'-phosphate oxidase family protein [Acetobacterium sp.]|nr:pyridoxamine 5'-phosphate oxidase family protein [Bacillota bacterium]MCG2730992.1 pyridoxamine 5'-phosphate oxidase family protein [Acetobacterium sp.]
MRRSNREVKDETELIEMIKGCKVCRVAMVDGDKPYIVPMNFGYQISGSAITIFLHCAKEGRKIELMKKNNQVCIELDQMKELITGETGCDYSCYFESFIGEGRAIFIETNEAKLSAFNSIMKHQTGRDDFSFDQRVVNQTTVIAVELSSFSGKRH